MKMKNKPNEITIDTILVCIGAAVVGGFIVYGFCILIETIYFIRVDHYTLQRMEDEANRAAHIIRNIENDIQRGQK
jgi:hypothetical protein